MATPPNKPRDIKDLKARLGRTVTPGQAGGSVPPMGPGGSLPPPKFGAPTPGVRGPAQGAPLPGMPTSISAPPFAQTPGKVGAMPSQQPGKPAARAGSPFDVAAPAMVTERKVRLVIDDSAIKEDELGRKSNSRNVILVVIGLALGLAAGLGVGSTAAERKQYSMAVRDGKDIYARVQELSKTLDAAQQSLKAAVDASRGGPGKQAHVDYKAIEALVALKHPFSADEFSRRRYLAFPTGAVDDLFAYYNGINTLWERFALLGAKISGDRARAALDKSAQATEELISTDFAIVIAKQDDAFVGGMVVVRPKPPEPGKEPKPDDPKILMVSSKEGGREVERTLFAGQDDFAEKIDTYAITVDKGRSMGTLGGAANLFGQYRGEVMATAAVMGKTAETQGRLIKALGEIAKLAD
jgi:hypothetical protein